MVVVGIAGRGMGVFSWIVVGLISVVMVGGYMSGGGVGAGWISGTGTNSEV